MSALLAEVRVDGAPGPKGSVNAFCVTCARLGRPQKVVVKEQSEVGALFRKLIARKLRLFGPYLTDEKLPYSGPIWTSLTFYIERKRVIKKGVETDQWWQSHEGPYPIHQQSGDAEKHARTVHDALMDAGLIADDSQVVDVIARKRWATAEHPPGAVIKVYPMPEEEA